MMLVGCSTRSCGSTSVWPPSVASCRSSCSSCSQNTQRKWFSSAQSSRSSLLCGRVNLPRHCFRLQFLQQRDERRFVSRSSSIFSSGQFRSFGNRKKKRQLFGRPRAGINKVALSPEELKDKIRIIEDPMNYRM